MSGPDLVNLEGHHEFDITWPWTGRRRLDRGSTAVLRVKDEAANPILKGIKDGEVWGPTDV